MGWKRAAFLIEKRREFNIFFYFPLNLEIETETFQYTIKRSTKKTHLVIH